MKTKLLGVVAALALLTTANSVAQAATYNYSLNWNSQRKIVAPALR